MLDATTSATSILCLDDVTALIESAAAMRNMQIEANDNGHVSDSPTQGKSKIKSRGLLPMRGRKKDTSNETDSAALTNVSVLDSSLKNNGDDNKKTKYRCGGCGSIQQSHSVAYHVEKPSLLHTSRNRTLIPQIQLLTSFSKEVNLLLRLTLEMGLPRRRQRC